MVTQRSHHNSPYPDKRAPLRRIGGQHLPRRRWRAADLTFRERRSREESSAYALSYGRTLVSPAQYDGRMLRYHIASHLPRTSGEIVVAEALDFPGAVTQGFDLADARLMIASAMEDLAQCLLEEGMPLPAPNPDATADADLIELVPLSVHVGAPRA
jgi:predicted RNase H-like HicB family nuclease